MFRFVLCGAAIVKIHPATKRRTGFIPFGILVDSQTLLSVMQSSRSEAMWTTAPTKIRNKKDIVAHTETALASRSTISHKLNLSVPTTILEWCRSSCTLPSFGDDENSCFEMPFVCGDSVILPLKIFYSLDQKEGFDMYSSYIEWGAMSCRCIQILSSKIVRLFRRFYSRFSFFLIFLFCWVGQTNVW